MSTLTPEKKQRVKEILDKINLHKETADILTNPQNYSAETVAASRLANTHNVARICDWVLPNRVAILPDQGWAIKRQLYNLIQDHCAIMTAYWKEFDDALFNSDATVPPASPVLTETQEELSNILAQVHISEETFLKLFNHVGFTVVD